MIPWLIQDVREIGDRRNIKIAIFIKIFCDCFITTMNREKIFLGEIIFSIIQKNIDAVIIF